ncbi:hypothetical protein EDB87DRAFT_482486 [Lactarius vividus]|nr:hypothetical protein EDB87DRAFT_482486 [Lactarius vividus]
MVNFNDPAASPAVVDADFHALENFVFAVQGVYIWEYFSTLWFEWSFITGEQPYRWSIWVYSGTRLLTLMNAVSNLVGFSVKTRMNCQLWLYSELISAHAAFSLRSLLLILRISAIWSGNKLILGPCLCAYLTNIAFLIRNIVITKVSWAEQVGACVFVDGEQSRDNIMATFFSEVFLLLVMTIGLLRQRDHHLGRLLFNQCMICLVVATFAEVPPFIVLFLKLSGPLNMMFQVSCLPAMTICVTRMYRGLSAVWDRRHHANVPKTFNIPITVQDNGGVSSVSTRPLSLQLRAAVHTTMSPQSLHSRDVGDKEDGAESELGANKMIGPGVV